MYQIKGDIMNMITISLEYWTRNQSPARYDLQNRPIISMEALQESLFLNFEHFPNSISSKKFVIWS